MGIMSTVKEGDVLVLQCGMEVNVRLIGKRDYGMFPYTVWNENETIPFDDYDEDGRSENGPEWRVIGVVRNGVRDTEEAKRFNSNKTPYGNLPLDLLDGAARVMAKGEVKYGRANYRKGYSDLLSPYHSLLRHVVALQPVIEQELFGETGGLYDEESGEAHIHHVITSALILIHALRKKGIQV